MLAPFGKEFVEDMRFEPVAATLVRVCSDAVLSLQGIPLPVIGLENTEQLVLRTQEMIGGHDPEGYYT